MASGARRTELACDAQARWWLAVAGVARAGGGAGWRGTGLLIAGSRQVRPRDRALQAHSRRCMCPALRVGSCAFATSFETRDEQIFGHLAGVVPGVLRRWLFFLFFLPHSRGPRKKNSSNQKTPVSNLPHGRALCGTQTLGTQARYSEKWRPAR